jgi:hypothetical protein
MINIVVAEFLDFDLGHKYRWSDGRLELHGSWNNWTTPMICTVAVYRSRFYGYGLLSIPPGVHESKWKFVGPTSVGLQTDWFGDLSGRPTASHYRNQVLDTSEINLTGIKHIPYWFDEIANDQNQPKYIDILNHIHKNIQIDELDNQCVFCTDIDSPTNSDGINDLTDQTQPVDMICLNGHGIHVDCYYRFVADHKSIWCPRCGCCYAEHLEIFPMSRIATDGY